jgi:hypothetical protein
MQQFTCILFLELDLLMHGHIIASCWYANSQMSQGRAVTQGHEGVSCMH